MAIRPDERGSEGLGEITERKGEIPHRRKNTKAREKTRENRRREQERGAGSGEGTGLSPIKCQSNERESHNERGLIRR
jgi:hypothetical protein